MARTVTRQLRGAFLRRDWLRAEQPRAVSDHVVSIIEHVPRVEAMFGLLFSEAVSGKPDWLPSGTFPPPKKYASRLKQQQMSATVIQSDIDRMFSRRVRAPRHCARSVEGQCRHVTATPSAQNTIRSRAVETVKGATGRVIELVLKAMYELVRCTTLSQGAFQQLEVDTSMLRWTLRECVDDMSVIQSLLDEVMTSAHERCLHPEALEAEVVEAVCEAKCQQLVAKHVADGPAGE